MRMSASRIRSINRSIARVNGIICGASDSPRRISAKSRSLELSLSRHARSESSPCQSP